MATQWVVSRLTLWGVDLELYANGRMQVAIHVTIAAVGPNGGRHTLSDNELNTIELIDYFNPGVPLGSGWSFTATENDYAHSFQGTNSDSHVDGPNGRVDLQHKTWWVSTTKVEPKSIGARIRQPNGTVVTTSSTEFDDKVSVRGKMPIHIGINNTEFSKVEMLREGTLEQDNFYLSSKIHPLREASISGYRGKSAITGLDYATSFLPQGPVYSSIHYMWPWGPETTAKVGITHHESGTPIVEGINDQPTITIRSHAHSLCLTRMLLRTGNQLWREGWNTKPHFMVRDIYGNQGNFSVHREGDNDMIIRESNPASFAAETPEKIGLV